MIKTVIITGTSRGLGYSLVEYFLKKEWKVFCVVRTENDAVPPKNQVTLVILDKFIIKD